MSGSNDDDSTARGRSGDAERASEVPAVGDRDSNPDEERRAQLPVEASLDQAIMVGEAAADALRPRDSEPLEVPLRESLLAGMRQTSTTLFEVGEVARRLSMLPPGIADARRTVRQTVLSFVVGLTFVLLATMALAGGTWRLVLGIFAGTALATLMVFGALRGVSHLAARGGTRQLPGPALAWIGVDFVGAITATVGLTWGVSEVTKPLALTHRLQRPPTSPSAAAAPSAPSTPERADAAMRRGAHVSTSGGVLFAPPGFTSKDGRFDVLIHYHGNVELVEQSVVAAKLNALVLIVNLGDGSGRYSEPLRNPRAFDSTLDRIEERAGELGLRSPRIQRIALSSWSAGYGAVYFILNSRSRLDRVDAVLLMDSMHGSFAPGSKTQVYPISLAPFVRFARRATAGEKLMVVTHSAVETQGYPSTTQTADAMLAELSVARRRVSPDAASPEPVDLPVALRAFPSNERRWLRVTSEAHQGDFHLVGCTGGGKGDHIAHLAQMKNTVLAPLVDRWSSAAAPRNP